MKLFAGAGSSPICFPREMFPLEGFQGIHDDPSARILLMKSNQLIALVSLELVNVFGEGVDLVKKIVSERCGVSGENIWVHQTHAITTPHIPKDPKEMRPGEKLPTHMLDAVSAEKKAMFLQALTDAVVCAADQAKQLKEARMGFGLGKSNVNVNRDIETPFGWWIGLNPEGYSNKTMQILRVETVNGELIALLVNYGLKPCAIDNSEMGSNGRLISSDVPGLACSLVQKELNVPCLFVMSAAGDQVPREMTLLETVTENGAAIPVDGGVAKGLEIVDRLGKEMAEDILRDAATINCSRENVEFRRDKVVVPCVTKGRIAMAPRRSVDYTIEREVMVDAEILTLDDIALVAAKPEINAITEKVLAERSPFAATLIFSMTNGGMKYMPDADSYRKITWESQSAMLVEGSAEKWVDAVAEKLKTMKK